MYESSYTSVKSMWGETGNVMIRIEGYQSSALSLYLFSVVMDEVNYKGNTE